MQRQVKLMPSLLLVEALAASSCVSFCPTWQMHSSPRQQQPLPQPDMQQQLVLVVAAAATARLLQLQEQRQQQRQVRGCCRCRN
jgi:hypothetical protein